MNGALATVRGGGGNPADMDTSLQSPTLLAKRAPMKVALKLP